MSPIKFEGFNGSHRKAKEWINPSERDRKIDESIMKRDEELKKNIDKFEENYENVEQGDLIKIKMIANWVEGDVRYSPGGGEKHDGVYLVTQEQAKSMTNQCILVK